MKNGLELAKGVDMGGYVGLGQGRDILYEKAGEDDNIGIVVEENGKTYNYEFLYQPESTLLENKSAENLADVIDTDDFIYLSAYRIEPQRFLLIMSCSKWF